MKGSQRLMKLLNFPSIDRWMNETSDYRMSKQTISLMEGKCKIKSKIARDIFINLCSIAKNTLINPRVCIDIQLRYPRLYRNILLLQKHCNDKTRIFFSLSFSYTRSPFNRSHSFAFNWWCCAWNFYTFFLIIFACLVECYKILASLKEVNLWGIWNCIYWFL